MGERPSREAADGGERLIDAALPSTARFQRICLIHYHEIGLKGHNRGVFERRLQRNVEALVTTFPVVTIHRIAGRLCLFLKEGVSRTLALDCARILRTIPGVARVSCGIKCERDMALINEAAIAVAAESEAFVSFKIKARRNHTDFPIDSMELNRRVGQAVADAFPEAIVRMKEPDLTIGVEVIQNAVYVYGSSQRGIGGLPVGTGGKAVCLLSSGIDSPVALWRMARRGAVCIGVHFSGRPQTSDESEYLVRDIATVLERSGCIARTYTIPLGDHQRTIALNCPPALRIILYRRLMMDVAAAIAEREGARALVTGESLGQVASQTLDNIAVVNEAVELPVLRPLIGMDKLEIIHDAETLGTFEISSQKAADCCTLFMPRSPETHAKLADVLAAEAEWPREQWVAELIDAATIIDYACPAYRRTAVRRDDANR